MFLYKENLLTQHNVKAFMLYSSIEHLFLKKNNTYSFGSLGI